MTDWKPFFQKARKGLNKFNVGKPTDSNSTANIVDHHMKAKAKRAPFIIHPSVIRPKSHQENKRKQSNSINQAQGQKVDNGVVQTGLRHPQFHRPRQTSPIHPWEQCIQSFGQGQVRCRCEIRRGGCGVLDSHDAGGISSDDC
jgi:hypothetical protein